VSQVVALIAGLGNPGAGYVSTRHNAGFWFADELLRRGGGAWRLENKFNGEVARIRIADAEVWMIKPMTFMNRSGQAVRALADFYKIPASHILVAHDELDLAPGIARFKRGGGHGGHNGLRDLHRHFGGPDYGRLRIGIGHPGHRDEVLNYVLGKPSAEDARAIEDAITASANATETLLRKGWEHAFNELHSRGAE
jgi:PTH1 family peptidyl-tRNA hydrolase